MNYFVNVMGVFTLLLKLQLDVLNHSNESPPHMKSSDLFKNGSLKRGHGMLANLNIFLAFVIPIAIPNSVLPKWMNTVLKADPWR